MGPLVLPALISGAASVAGGIMGGSSAKEQNKKNREWQEHMRNTQYQATVKDMKKAGLNPMMLASGGSLSQGMAPGGVQSEQQLSEGISSAGPRAMEAAVQGAQLKNINSATAKMQAEAQSITQSKNIEAMLFRIANPGYDVGPDGSMVMPAERPTGKPKGELDREQLEQLIRESQARVEGISASAAASRASAEASAARAALDRAGLSEAQAKKWLWDNAREIAAALTRGQSITQIIRSLLFNGGK